MTNFYKKIQPKEIKLSLLPVNWKVVSIKDCIINKRIKIGKVRQQEYKKAGKFPIVDQGQNLIAGFWDKEEDVYKGELPVIIFGDHTRIIKFIDFPFVAGADGTKVLLPDVSNLYTKEDCCGVEGGAGGERKN